MVATPRIGMGVDVHCFAPEGSERVLHLAGLAWPDEPALEGHSDADVAAHAAADALLSAAGLGDLGSVFGTDGPLWAGVAGTELLAEAARLGFVRAVVPAGSVEAGSAPPGIELIEVGDLAEAVRATGVAGQR